jgi:undecaprenyl-diphosphatase
MEAIWQWGLEVIRTIQQIHGPALDTFFKGVTFMGEEPFFLILLPLIFWCVDFVVGARLAVLLLLSGYTTNGLKDLFAQPRPFQLDPAVKLYDVDGYGLPSGHAQAAVIVWGYLASVSRKTWAWIVAIVLVALIGFSRIYLGVHFPTDVLGGWALGIVLLVAYLALEPRVEAWLKRAGLGVQLALVVVVPLGLLLIYPTKDIVSAMAVLMGTGVGLVLVGRVARFSAAGPLWQRAVRFLIGMVGLLALYLGLRMIFPGEGEPLYFVLRTVRYVLVGLWISLGAPWLFLRLRLARG